MKLTHLVLGAALAICAASCSTKTAPLQYFEDLPAELTTVTAFPAPVITIAPGDELFISVTSLEPQATAAYNMPLTNTVDKTSLLNANATPQMVSYIVNSKGDITMPVLGIVHVEGLTTEQLQANLTARIAKDVENPVVRVELVNFTVNVLGEVNSPSRVNVGKERFTILDALAAGGDLTIYGDRSNVLLIRQLPDGTQQRVRIDLNSSEVLTSPYFYLQPNDVIYVSPNAVGKDNAKYNTNNSFKISVISTIVSCVSVVASLTIALTR